MDLGMMTTPPLGVPAQCHLGGCFVIFPADFRQYRVRKDAVFALGHRSPCFRLDVQSFHVADGAGLGKEGVQFHLVDHRSDAGVQAQIGQTVRVKVAYADGRIFPASYNSSMARQEP